MAEKTSGKGKDDQNIKAGRDSASEAAKNDALSERSTGQFKKKDDGKRTTNSGGPRRNDDDK